MKIYSTSLSAYRPEEKDMYGISKDDPVYLIDCWQFEDPLSCYNNLKYAIGKVSKDMDLIRQPLSLG